MNCRLFTDFEKKFFTIWSGKNVVVCFPHNKKLIFMSVSLRVTLNNPFIGLPMLASDFAARPMVDDGLIRAAQRDRRLDLKKCAVLVSAGQLQGLHDISLNVLQCVEVRATCWLQLIIKFV